MRVEKTKKQKTDFKKKKRGFIFSHYSTVTTNNVQKEFTQMGIEGLFYDCPQLRSK